jgi:hypothetical protein
VSIPEDDIPTKRDPQPPPVANPLRHLSGLIRLGHQKPSPPPTAAPNPEAGHFVDDEAITTQKGIEHRARMLVQYFAACSSEDQVYLLKLAEGYANRNAKT